MVPHLRREIGSTQRTQEWPGRIRERIGGEISHAVRRTADVARGPEV